MSDSANVQTSKTSSLKDNFNVSFLDCHCCCEASKEMDRCQNNSSQFLRNIQEYLHLPEYRLNCQCLCGDNDRKSGPLNFGIHLTPANDLKWARRELTVPRRTKRPVAPVTGRAVAAVRAVFNACSIVLPVWFDWVFNRSIPVIGRPDIVIGLRNEANKMTFPLIDARKTSLLDSVRLFHQLNWPWAAVKMFPVWVLVERRFHPTDQRDLHRQFRFHRRRVVQLMHAFSEAKRPEMIDQCRFDGEEDDLTWSFGFLSRTRVVTSTHLSNCRRRNKLNAWNRISGSGMMTRASMRISHPFTFTIICSICQRVSKQRTTSVIC